LVALTWALFCPGKAAQENSKNPETVKARTTFIIAFFADGWKIPSLLDWSLTGERKVTDLRTTATRDQTRAIKQYRLFFLLSLLSYLFSLLILGSPAAGFDTFWHAQATQTAGNDFGFTPDATNVMKLGNFSPDLFGPVEDYAAKHLAPPERQACFRSAECATARRRGVLSFR
jgi:hypothetical protein